MSLKNKQKTLQRIQYRKRKNKKNILIIKNNINDFRSDFQKSWSNLHGSGF